MSTVTMTAGAKPVSITRASLDLAAQFWFCVTFGGQLLMAAYVALFYGGTAVQGRFDAWTRVLSRGYVRGDAMGNTALIVHIGAAVFLLTAGALQLIPAMRARLPRIHRWTGRIYVPAAMATGLAGLYMTWFRDAIGDLWQHLGGTLNAILIVHFGMLAIGTARKRRFAEHREWALRLYLMVSANWLFRVALFAWIFANGGPAGFDVETFTGPALTFLSFANSLVPLAVLELYLQARGPVARMAVAMLLGALTLVLAFGIFAVTVAMWLPALRTVI